MAYNEAECERSGDRRRVTNDKDMAIRNALFNNESFKCK
jgi:hypothetical protein